MPRRPMPSSDSRCVTCEVLILAMLAMLSNDLGPTVLPTIRSVSWNGKIIGKQERAVRSHYPNLFSCGGEDDVENMLNR